MITKDKDDKLVKIYFFICKMFNEELKYYCERFSNNSTPEFSDEEIMTIYLYVMQCENLVRVKHIHRFAENYLRSWFPKLGSYQAFDNRLNNLNGAFSRLVTPTGRLLLISKCLRFITNNNMFWKTVQ